MIKKAFLLLALLMPLAMSAQYTMGDWRLHATFVAAQSQCCIDTGDKVYYLTSGSLFCFDKETLENETLDKSNYLSDMNISNIYYNYTKRYVVIAYANSNIDVITADGKLVNMPEIKDAVITSSKAINDITFADSGLMYVATDFGYVVIDDSKFVVKESHLYYSAFTSIAQVGTRLVAVIDGMIRVSPVDAAHDAESAFISTSSPLAGGKVYPINNTKFFAYSTGKLYVGTLGGTATAPKATWKTISSAAGPDYVQPTPSGYIANFMAKGYYYTLDAAGTNPEQVSGGQAMYSCNPKGDGTMWCLSEAGLHKNGDNTNVYRPDGITIVGNPFWSTYNSGLKKLYIQTSADNYVNESSSDARIMEVATYDGTQWRNETPDKIGSTPSASSDRVYYSGYQLVVNPNDPNTYFFSTRKMGVYKVTNGKTVDIFTSANTPGQAYRGATAFDSQGNLWLVHSYNSSSTANTVVALPKANVNSTAAVKTSDWKKITVPNLALGEFKRASFVIGNNDVKVYNAGAHQNNTIIWRGDINNANPEVKSFPSFTDQDNKTVSWTFLRGMAVDKNGHVWMGMDGIIEFDPNEAFNADFRVNHVKVPRNDGTGLADYLLEGVTTNCIAVDALNRKWIGTSSMGVYLVSPDGSQVLKHFDTSNSLLPSDNVFSIACTDDKSVFFVTSSGIVEYIDGTSPSSSDLSDVYCYPNPVRPDFTGLLTINGLPDNTLVKIADSAGNVVKQMRSNGGIATWDCCGSDGDRVATGVYYVLASTAGDSSSTLVTKFLVVK